MTLGESRKLDIDLSGVPEPGDTVAAKYVIEERLGVGGMGAVLRARRISDDEQVAIKVMLADEAQHEDSTKRFFREARAVGSIKSPHVTRLLDLGRLDDGMPFMVLELLHGEALDQIIVEEAPLAVPVAVDYTLQACEGVAHAHAIGVIHRDLKPSNLFRIALPQGHVVKVLDFGISKATMRLEPGSDHKSLTETHTTLGSPQYMSPEQLRSSKDVDERTDIWSLGLILYKLLTGTPAFEASTVGEHFAMIFADPPTPLRARRPDAPASLERAISMCVERDLDKRFRDVGQLAMAIAQHGPAGSLERAARVVAILERAGVSSASHPHLELDSGPRRDAPTVRVGPPPSNRVPDMTTSQWSSSTRSAPPPAPPRTRAGWMLGGGAGLLCALLLGAWALSTPTLHAQSTLAEALHRGAAGVPAAAPPDAFDAREVIDRLQHKLDEGSASKDELGKLVALCSAAGDKPCADAAYAAWKQAQAGAPAASASARSKRPVAAPRSRPHPHPPPSSKPQGTEIKPKGPLVETL